MEVSEAGKIAVETAASEEEGVGLFLHPPYTSLNSDPLLGGELANGALKLLCWLVPCQLNTSSSHPSGGNLDSENASSIGLWASLQHILFISD